MIEGGCPPEFPHLCTDPVSARFGLCARDAVQCYVAEGARETAMIPSESENCGRDRECILGTTDPIFIATGVGSGV